MVAAVHRSGARHVPGGAVIHPLMSDPFIRDFDAETVARKNRANRRNGSTTLGLFVARLGRCRITEGPRGMWLADRYRFSFPKAGAFTVGSVAITAHEWPEILAHREWLFRHEEWHSFQYEECGGLPFIPQYLLAAAWSKLLTGDYWSRNRFEQGAGLLIGGYREHEVRTVLRPFARSRRP